MSGPCAAQNLYSKGKLAPLTCCLQVVVFSPVHVHCHKSCASSSFYFGFELLGVPVVCSFTKLLSFNRALPGPQICEPLNCVQVSTSILMLGNDKTRELKPSTV